VTTLAAPFARRPRSFVSVTGPDAADYLERMLSNAVAALAAGASCDALLLTPKARVVAPLRVLRRAPDDFLLLTDPGLGARVRSELLRGRFAARVQIEPEEHTSVVLFGAVEGGIPCPDYGTPAVEVLDPDRLGEEEIPAGELERLRIRAGTPAWGLEIDDRVLPAEAGLVESAVSFTKGCYPGQEPIARLHYRGHANRGLRVLAIDAEAAPARDAEVTFEGKAVGRVTSVAPDPEAGFVALAYVRAEVPAGAELGVGGSAATQLH
jgi:folate-binding protein YgfZ